jgi:hypothetical protein
MVAVSFYVSLFGCQSQRVLEGAQTWSVPSSRAPTLLSLWQWHRTDGWESSTRVAVSLYLSGWMCEGRKEVCLHQTGGAGAFFFFLVVLGFFFFLNLIFISILYWGYIVTFTKVLTIYLS